MKLETLKKYTIVSTNEIIHLFTSKQGGGDSCYIITVVWHKKEKDISVGIDVKMQTFFGNSENQVMDEATKWLNDNFKDVSITELN